MTSPPRPNPYAPPAAPADDVSPGRSGDELQKLQARVAGAFLVVALVIASYNAVRGHDLSEPSGRLFGMLLGFSAFLLPTISFLRGERRFRFLVIGLLAVAVIAALSKMSYGPSHWSVTLLVRALSLLGAIVLLVTGTPSRRRLVVGAALGGAFVISQALALLGIRVGFS